jgi:hypothetical protein
MEDCRRESEDHIGLGELVDKEGSDGGGLFQGREVSVNEDVRINAPLESVALPSNISS